MKPNHETGAELEKRVITTESSARMSGDDLFRSEEESEWKSDQEKYCLSVGREDSVRRRIRRGRRHLRRISW